MASSIFIDYYYALNDFAMFLFILGIGIGLIGALLLRKSREYWVEHAWVECKNRKKPTDIVQIETVWSQWQHYHLTNNKQYKFRYLYFVSASGFVENALKVATDRKINCFIKEGDKFKQIYYWD